MRLESVTRANFLLDEQTDRMKQLRSKQLYSDVIHDRSQQILEKVSVRDEEKSFEAACHNRIIEQGKKGDLNDQMKATAVTEKNKLIAAVRRAQSEEIAMRKIAELEEKQLIGLALKKRNEVILEEEKQIHDLKQKKALENRRQIIEANENLKLMRTHLSDEEKRAEEIRDADIRVVEERKNALRELGCMQTMKAQMRRQLIIDAATKNLTDMSIQENEIFYKQVVDIKERELREQSSKESKRKKEWNAIVESRREQISFRAEKASAKFNEDDKLAELWRTINQTTIAEDNRKASNSREQVKQIKAAQLADSISAQKNKIDQRIAEIESERALQQAEGDVDARFVRACKDEIERYAADKKPLYPLLVALRQKEPALISGRKTLLKKRVPTV